MCRSVVGNNFIAAVAVADYADAAVATAKHFAVFSLPALMKTNDRRLKLSDGKLN